MKPQSDQISLFDAPAPSVPLTPSQASKIAAQRREWKKRQRKHRALLKAAQRWTPTDVTVPSVTAPGPFSWPPVKDTTDAELYLCAALTVRRDFMARVSELVRPSRFSDPTTRLIAESAFSLHARGVQVTRDSILCELKKNRVLVLGGARAIDAVIGVLPLEITPAHLEFWAGHLKEAS